MDGETEAECDLLSGPFVAVGHTEDSCHQKTAARGSRDGDHPGN